MSFDLKPHRLSGTIQHYAWGAKGEQALIARLLKITPENDKPYAELWIGAHPKAPSHLIYQGKSYSLDTILSKYPRLVLGEEVVDKFGITLPFLLKILSAQEPLSIQVHPDKQQARLLNQYDPQNYPDSNHKPEIALVLDELECLAGFRPANELRMLLSDYPAIASVLSGHEFIDISDDRQFVRELWQHSLTTFQNQPLIIDQTLKDLARQQNNDSAIDDANVQFFLQMQRQGHAPDFGLLLILFLQYWHLYKSDALFIPAGVLHAYIRGNIVECMTNSDNVIRAGLTTKFKDYQALATVTNPEAQPSIVLPRIHNGKKTYQIAAEEFRLAEIELNEKKYLTINRGEVRIILVLEGEIRISWAGGEELYTSGESILLPAALDKVKISTKHSARFCMVEVEGN